MNDTREIRKRPSAVIRCPQCGSKITLMQETHEWNSHGEHTDYGPGIGECCGVAYLDDPWDGIQAFRIPLENAR